VLSTDERDALAALHYDDGAPPDDPSNRVADDATARAFGQRLFFETAFSGPLLEGDNDGTSATLGVQGESGRVSCAGCHLPTAGFVDARSPHHQVSLAAQWTLRKTPTLLEVAFAPLYNWDGRRDAIVPRAALLNIVHAAPRGTIVRWYDAPHELDRAAYRDAFAWLARKLRAQTTN